MLDDDYRGVVREEEGAVFLLSHFASVTHLDTVRWIDPSITCSPVTPHHG